MELSSTGTLKITMKGQIGHNERVSLSSSHEEEGIRYRINNSELSEPLIGVKHIDVVGWGVTKVLGLSSVNIEGDLTIRTGLPRDSISLNDSFIGGKLNIITRDGDDYISVVNSYIVGRATINLGKGDDYIHTRYSTFLSSYRLITSEGSDVATQHNTDYAKNANIYMGVGDDTLISTYANIRDEHRIVTGVGMDWVYLRESDIEGDLTVKTGADNDLLTIRSTTVSGRVLLKDSSGSEDVYEYDDFNEFFGRSANIGFDTLVPDPVEQRAGSL